MDHHELVTQLKAVEGIARLALQKVTGLVASGGLVSTQSQRAAGPLVLNGGLQILVSVNYTLAAGQKAIIMGCAEYQSTMAGSGTISVQTGGGGGPTDTVSPTFAANQNVAVTRIVEGGAAPGTYTASIEASATGTCSAFNGSLVVLVVSV